MKREFVSEAPTILLLHQAGGYCEVYPALALRPRKEYDIESVRSQMDEFDRLGVQTCVADPGVHGSSMLSEDRVKASTKATWSVVLEFLETLLQQD